MTLPNAAQSAPHHSPKSAPAATASTVRGKKIKLAMVCAMRKNSGAAGYCAMASLMASAPRWPRLASIQPTPAMTTSTSAIRPAAPQRASVVGSDIVFHDLGALGPTHQPHPAHELGNSDEQPVERAVIRGSTNARTMVHHHRDGAAALALDQCRQEAVTMVEKRQVEEQRAAEEVEAAAGIRAPPAPP